MTDIGIFEAIHTARSLRRLKLDPVPEALITRILDAAIRAPSAGNAQNWAFVVVREPVGAPRARRHLSKGLAHRGRDVRRQRPAAAPHRTAVPRMMTSGTYLWAHMGDAPVILVPCQRRPVVPPAEALPPELRDRHPAELSYVERIRGASLYPAVQNILLACRALGLGTTITTNHIRIEGEVKAVLGLPDDVDTFAMMPIGWPIDPFGPLTRRPVAEVVHADRWGQPWPA